MSKKQQPSCLQTEIRLCMHASYEDMLADSYHIHSPSFVFSHYATRIRPSVHISKCPKRIRFQDKRWTDRVLPRPIIHLELTTF